MVSFSCLESKKEMMNTAKKERLTGKNLDNNWIDSGICINKQMIQYNRDPFYKIRNKAKELGHKFVTFNTFYHLR